MTTSATVSTNTQLSSLLPRKWPTPRARALPFPVALALLLAFAIPMAQAATGMSHGDQKMPVAEQPHAMDSGTPGKTGDVTRVVDLSLRDSMIITPGRIRVSQGETVRLRIRNTGKIKHEFVLGSRKEIVEHWSEMSKMPSMEHEEPNAVEVAPGGTAELIWRFSKPGKVLYACLQPLHWEAGMAGVITVMPRSSR
jgi:uncharacterized cupredoxin-like copper-binding protein